MPKISVIIPVYNGMPFIERAIQSALDQTRPPHEIIVVDDGSTDETAAVLKKFEGRIRTRQIPNSGGASTPRNAAVRLSTGEYLAFLDADDVWFRRKLEVISGYISRYPEIDLFSSDFVARYPVFKNRMVKHFSKLPNRKMLNFGEPLKPNGYGLMMHSYFLGAPGAVVMKKHAAEEAGLFDESINLVEDLDFFLRVFTKATCVLIDEVLWYKRSLSNSLSFNSLRLYSAHRKIYENSILRQTRFIRENGLTFTCRSSISELSYTIGNLNFETGNAKQAFREYLYALKKNPRPANLGIFLWTCFKKILRMSSFDNFSRKRLLTKV